MCFVGRRAASARNVPRPPLIHAVLRSDAGRRTGLDFRAHSGPRRAGLLRHQPAILFSYIDSQGYGSGNKLPHNITSLLGVMDGAASDLRSGLPWQGVEIHEPMRLLFMIETTPEAILGIIEHDPVVGRILRNGWVQLALLDPEANAIRVYRDGGFQLYDPSVDEVPKVEKSIDWYGGWRDHLAFAVVEPHDIGSRPNARRVWPKLRRAKHVRPVATADHRSHSEQKNFRSPTYCEPTVR